LVGLFSFQSAGGGSKTTLPKHIVDSNGGPTLETFPIRADLAGYIAFFSIVARLCGVVFVDALRLGEPCYSNSKHSPMTRFEYG